jgi:hypothetical protein
MSQTFMKSPDYSHEANNFQIHLFDFFAFNMRLVSSTGNFYIAFQHEINLHKLQKMNLFRIIFINSNIYFIFHFQCQTSIKS